MEAGSPRLCLGGEWGGKGAAKGPEVGTGLCVNVTWRSSSPGCPASLQDVRWAG